MITELNSSDCWLPGASLWVTTLSTPWKAIFDYKLNFQITQFFKRLEQKNTPLKQEELLIFVPHNMLPTEFVVLLSSWNEIQQIKKIKLPYHSIIIRLFQPSKQLNFQDLLTNPYQIEVVNHNGRV